MSERDGRLLESLNKIDEEKIDKAAPAEIKKQFHWRRLGAIAAALSLVAGLSAGVFIGKGPWLQIGGNESGSGRQDDSSIFMSYAGPVLSLTTAEGGEGLTADRAVTYDFQGWMARDYDHPYYGLLITDRYTLTNPTVEDKEVTLLYPFVGSLYTVTRQLPTLTVDGKTLEANLLTGQYSWIDNGRSGGLPSMSDPKSWEEYKVLLSNGDYQAEALEDWPDLTSMPVTVYEITNPWMAEDVEGDNPTIHAGFSLDYSKTIPLSYGFNGGSYDRDGGTMRQSFSVPIPPSNNSSENQAFYKTQLSDPHYLIVVGEPVGDLQLFATYDGNPESIDYMEWNKSIGADLRQYDTNLDSALRLAAERMLSGVHWANSSGKADEENRPDFELYFGMMKDCLLDTGVLSGDPEDSYDLHMLEDMCFESIRRVFYLTARIAIPAGGSITVEASFFKEESFDFACASTQGTSVYGYDLVTKLSTNLDFTYQTARVLNTENVEIVHQNFGFDLKNGINDVTLDPDQEHYYLEYKIREVQFNK